MTARKFAVELDVLRGLAALLMIANHGGYRLLTAADATQGVLGASVFIGSFAPVVFFFATGLGIALGAKAPNLRSVLIKALLLIVADQLFFWRRDLPWGLDFLGFIAVSSVLVSLIAQSSRAMGLCVAGIVGLLALRYAIAPRLPVPGFDPGALEWLMGVRAVPEVSYPASPWLVYPLLGFMAGRIYRKVDLHEPMPRNRWLAVGAAVAVATLLAAAGLAAWGAVFHRWGTVSASYFVLSLGVLACAGLLSMVVTMVWPRIASGLSLRGVASFAVIPVHYAMLEAAAAIFDPPLAPWAYSLCVAGIAIACFAVSSWFSQRVSALLAGKRRAAVAWPLVVLLVACIAGAVGFGMRSPALSFIFSVVGQLAVAGLLGLRLSSSASVPDRQR